MTGTADELTPASNMQVPVQVKDGVITLAGDVVVLALLVLPRLRQHHLAGELLSATCTLRGGAALSLLRQVYSVSGVANGISGDLTVSLLLTLLNALAYMSAIASVTVHRTVCSGHLCAGGAKDQHVSHEDKWRAPHGKLLPI